MDGTEPLVLARSRPAAGGVITVRASSWQRNCIINGLGLPYVSLNGVRKAFMIECKVWTVLRGT